MVYRNDQQKLIDIGSATYAETLAEIKDTATIKAIH